MNEMDFIPLKIWVFTTMEIAIFKADLPKAESVLSSVVKSQVQVKG